MRKRSPSSQVLSSGCTGPNRSPDATILPRTARFRLCAKIEHCTSFAFKPYGQVVTCRHSMSRVLGCVLSHPLHISTSPGVITTKASSSPSTHANDAAPARSGNFFSALVGATMRSSCKRQASNDLTCLQRLRQADPFVPSAALRSQRGLLGWCARHSHSRHFRHDHRLSSLLDDQLSVSSWPIDLYKESVYGSLPRSCAVLPKTLGVKHLPAPLLELLGCG